MSHRAAIERRSAIPSCEKNILPYFLRDLIYNLILNPRCFLKRVSVNLATDTICYIAKAKSDIHFSVNEERKYIKNLKLAKAKIIALYCLGFIV